MFYKRIASALALATGVFAVSPITSSDGLVFNVLLANQTTAGGPFDLAVRLNEYNPSIGLPAFFDFYVGVDSNSPRLVGNLESGAIYSQGIGPNGEPYNDTYTGTPEESQYCEDVTVQTTVMIVGEKRTGIRSLTERNVSEEEDCQHDTFDSVVGLEK
jgi:hypothetical protein